MSFEIRPMKTGEGANCELVMRGLPGWFGIEQSILDYAKATEEMETLVAEVSGAIVGFITLNQHNPLSAEMHVLGVLRDYHGQGIGRALVEHVEAIARSRAIEFMQVKTLGPSHPDSNYAQTRLFYEHIGYRPLEENELWGKDSPCLIMVKHLSCADD